MLRQEKFEVAGDLAGKAILVNPSEYEAILTLAEFSVAKMIEAPNHCCAGSFFLFTAAHVAFP